MESLSAINLIESPSDFDINPELEEQLNNIEQGPLEIINEVKIKTSQISYFSKNDKINLINQKSRLIKDLRENFKELKLKIKRIYEIKDFYEKISKLKYFSSFKKYFEKYYKLNFFDFVRKNHIYKKSYYSLKLLSQEFMKEKKNYENELKKRKNYIQKLIEEKNMTQEDFYNSISILSESINNKETLEFVFEKLNLENEEILKIEKFSEFLFVLKNDKKNLNSLIEKKKNDIFIIKNCLKNFEVYKKESNYQNMVNFDEMDFLDLLILKIKNFFDEIGIKDLSFIFLYPKYNIQNFYKEKKIELKNLKNEKKREKKKKEISENFFDLIKKYLEDHLLFLKNEKKNFEILLSKNRQEKKLIKNRNNIIYKKKKNLLGYKIIKKAKSLENKIENHRKKILENKKKIKNLEKTIKNLNKKIIDPEKFLDLKEKEEFLFFKIDEINKNYMCETIENLVLINTNFSFIVEYILSLKFNFNKAINIFQRVENFIFNLENFYLKKKNFEKEKIFSERNSKQMAFVQYNLRFFDKKTESEKKFEIVKNIKTEKSFEIDIYEINEILGSLKNLNDFLDYNFVYSKLIPYFKNYKNKKKFCFEILNKILITKNEKFKQLELNISRISKEEQNFVEEKQIKIEKQKIKTYYNYEYKLISSRKISKEDLKFFKMISLFMNGVWIYKKKKSIKNSKICFPDFNPFLSNKYSPEKCKFEKVLFKFCLKKDEIQFLKLYTKFEKSIKKKNTKLSLPIIFFKKPLISNNTIDFIEYLNKENILNEYDQKYFFELSLTNKKFNRVDLIIPSFALFQILYSFLNFLARNKTVYTTIKKNIIVKS